MNIKDKMYGMESIVVMEDKQTQASLCLLVFFATPLVASLLTERALEITILLWLIEVSIFAFFLSRFEKSAESTEELARLQYQPSGPSSLEKGVAEARETLDAQIENLNDIDTKAIRILRVNVLLTGIILSALTFSAKTDVISFNKFLNIYFGLGVFLLISSTATAGLTYTASDSRVGMSKPNLQTLIAEDLSDDELNLVLTKSYAKWIQNNQSTEIINSFYSTSTILLLIYAITYIALGVYDALIQQVPFLLEGLSNVALLLMTLASGYPSQISRIIDELDFQVK